MIPAGDSGDPEWRAKTLDLCRAMRQEVRNFRRNRARGFKRLEEGYRMKYQPEAVNVLKIFTRWQAGKSLRTNSGFFPSERSRCVLVVESKRNRPAWSGWTPSGPDSRAPPDPGKSSFLRQPDRREERHLDVERQHQKPLAKYSAVTRNRRRDQMGRPDRIGKRLPLRNAPDVEVAVHAV